MTSDVKSLISHIESYQFCPAMIQRGVLEHLQKVTKGEVNIVDPTSPFVFALESAAVCTTAALNQIAASDRRSHPTVGITEQDIFRHMSDVDFINIFAIPSNATIVLALSQKELLLRMVDVDDTGERKLVIPRNTVFKVADTAYSIQYPIVFRQLPHGGMQVVYDTSVPSPLLQLDTNLLTWTVNNHEGTEWVIVDIPVQQFYIESSTSPATSAVSWKQSVTIPKGEQFYYARVYVEEANGNWAEIYTTHSDQIYDTRKLTAVINVTEAEVTISIPLVYTMTGALRTKVRTDVYLTKGYLNQDLGAYPDGSISAQWLAIDTRRDKNAFTVPIENMRMLKLMSESRTTGGRNKLPFEETRARVINNSTGQRLIPITSNQLGYKLRDHGYDIVTNVDNVTNREILATRQLPPPSNANLITASASSIKTALLSIRSALTQRTVIDNGDSITITPDTLYQIHGGVLEMVPDSKVSEILAMPPDKRAVAVTNAEYFYSPFHYVLDMSNNEFQVRPYYLDDPVALNKQFVAINGTTLVELSVDSYAMQRTSTGYVLTILTKSGESVRKAEDNEFYVQLAFVPTGERERAYITGVLVAKSESGERVYQFDLSSNMNVTSEGSIQLTKFKMFNDEDRVLDAPLVCDFDVLFSTTQVVPDNWKPSSVDRVLGKKFLPDRIYGVQHESIKVRFGHSLSTLWARARSVPSTVEYRRYERDIPLTYTMDVYEQDPATGATISIVNGEVVYNILHRKGDPVIDKETGSPIYKHRKGDIYLDANGDAVVINQRSMLRQFDILLLEAVYWFATDSVATEYRKEIVDTYLSWLLDDLANINDRVLDKTKIYFYPKATLGEIELVIGEGRVVRVNSSQSLQVTLLVEDSVYKNLELRDRLEKTTTALINNALKEEVFSISGVITLLRATYGDDVLDVTIAGVGGRTPINAYTVLTEGARCSLRKRLVAQGDNSLIVEEDVTYVFVNHTLKNAD